MSGGSRSLSYTRILTAVWGTWALVKGLTMEQPEGFFAAVDDKLPFTLAAVWTVIGLILLCGLAPSRLVPCKVTMWARIVGINLLAALVSVWLSAALVDFSISSFTTNGLIIAMALISAHAIAREGTRVGGDARGDPH